MAKFTEEQFFILKRIYKYYDENNIYIDKEKYGIDLTPHRMFSFFIIGEFGPKRWYSYSENISQQNLKYSRLENRSKLIDEPHGSFASLAINISNIFQSYFHAHDSEWFTSPEIIRGIVAQIELEWAKKELCGYQYSNYSLQEIAKRIRLYIRLENEKYFYKGRSTRFIKVIKEIKMQAISTLKESMANYYSNGQIKQFKDLIRVATYNSEIIFTILTSYDLQNDNEGRYQELINFIINSSEKISNMTIIDDIKKHHNKVMTIPYGMNYKIYNSFNGAKVENILVNFLNNLYKYLNDKLLSLDNLKTYALGENITGKSYKQINKSAFNIPTKGNLIPDQFYHHSGLKKKQIFDKSALEALIDMHKSFLICIALNSISASIEYFLEIYGENKLKNKEFKNSVYSFYNKISRNLFESVNPNKAIDELIYSFVKNKRNSDFLSAAKDKISTTPGLNSNGSLNILRNLIIQLNKNDEQIDTSGAEVGNINSFLKKHGGYLHNDLTNDELMNIIHTKGSSTDLTLICGSAAALTYILYKSSKIAKII